MLHSKLQFTLLSLDAGAQHLELLTATQGLQQQLTLEQGRAAEQQQERRRLESALQAAKAECEHHRDELWQTAEQLAASQQSCVAFSASRDAAQAAMDTLQQQLLALQQQAGAARQQVQEQEGHQQDLQAVLAVAEDARADLVVQVEEQAGQLQALQARWAQAEAARTGSARQVEALRSAAEEHAEERQVLQAALQEASRGGDTRPESLERELQTARRCLAVTDAAYTEALAALTASQQERNALAAAQQGWAQQLADMGSQLEAAQAAGQQLQARLQAAELGRDQALEQLSALQHVEAQVAAADQDSAHCLVAAQQAARGLREQLQAAQRGRVEALAEGERHHAEAPAHLETVQQQAEHWRQGLTSAQLAASQAQGALADSEQDLSLLLRQLAAVEQQRSGLERDYTSLQQLWGATVAAEAGSSHLAASLLQEVQAATSEHGLLQSDLDVARSDAQAALEVLAAQQEMCGEQSAELERLSMLLDCERAAAADIRIQLAAAQGQSQAEMEQRLRDRDARIR